MFSLTTPPPNPNQSSNPLPSSPSTSSLAMDKQQDAHFQKGSAKPIRFKNQGYATTRTYLHDFPLTFMNDSPQQGSSSLPKSGTSPPPFRFVARGSIDRGLGLIRTFSFQPRSSRLVVSTITGLV